MAGNATGGWPRASSAVALRAVRSAAWMSSARSSSMRYLAIRMASGRANRRMANTAVASMTVTIFRRTLTSGLPEDEARYLGTLSLGLSNDVLCLLLACGWPSWHRFGHSVGVVLSTWPSEPSSSRSRRRRGGSWRTLLSLLVAVVLVVWPVTSYLRALTYPGQASFAVRTVEWIRDNGGGDVIDFVESLWFASPPTAATPDATSVPADLAASAASVDPSVMPAPIPVAAGLVPLAAEGQWVAGRWARAAGP